MPTPDPRPYRHRRPKASQGWRCYCAHDEPNASLHTQNIRAACCGGRSYGPPPTAYTRMSEEDELWAMLTRNRKPPAPFTNSRHHLRAYTRGTSGSIIDRIDDAYSIGDEPLPLDDE